MFKHNVLVYVPAHSTCVDEPNEPVSLMICESQLLPTCAILCGVLVLPHSHSSIGVCQGHVPALYKFGSSHDTVHYLIILVLACVLVDCHWQGHLVVEVCRK